MAGRGTDIKLGGNKDFFEEGQESNSKQIEKDMSKVNSLGVYLLLVLKDMKAEE